MKVHDSGTTTLSTTMSWLPVPLSPFTSQFLTMDARSRGITAVRGNPGGPLAPPTCTPTPINWAPQQPLPQLQRPETSSPPATGTAFCGGKMPPAKTTSGPLA